MFAIRGSCAVSIVLCHVGLQHVTSGRVLSCPVQSALHFPLTISQFVHSQFTRETHPLSATLDPTRPNGREGVPRRTPAFLPHLPVDKDTPPLMPPLLTAPKTEDASSAALRDHTNPTKPKPSFPPTKLLIGMVLPSLDPFESRARPAPWPYRVTPSKACVFRSFPPSPIVTLSDIYPLFPPSFVSSFRSSKVDLDHCALRPLP